MVNSALHTRTTCSTKPWPPENRPWTTEPGPSLRVDEPLPQSSTSGIATFDIGSVELVRGFVEHLVAENASGALGNGGSARYRIDWDAMEASVADSRTLEQAIGRAVVIADQMSRGVFDDTHPGQSPSSLKAEEPFFAFSMANVVPDFGDASRYRTRVARTMSRLLGTRRTVVPLTVAGSKSPLTAQLENG